MSGRIVEVVIDDLVLSGFAPADRDRIAAAASRELERLLEARPEWAGVPSEVAVTSLGVGPGASPEVVGAEVARALHGELAP